jgi:hypothetical protein
MIGLWPGKEKLPDLELGLGFARGQLNGKRIGARFGPQMADTYYIRPRV